MSFIGIEYLSSGDDGNLWWDDGFSYLLWDDNLTELLWDV